VEDIKKQDRRDIFVKPYFQRAQPDQVVVILKAREPAGILIAIGDKEKNKWHLEIKQRWVDQYNFYLQDARWGPMFVRVCPYFPFSVRICLNQHYWLAQRLHEAGVRFTQTGITVTYFLTPRRRLLGVGALLAKHKDLGACKSIGMGKRFVHSVFENP